MLVRFKVSWRGRRHAEETLWFLWRKQCDTKEKQKTMATIDWLADRIGTRVMLYRILPETSDNMSSFVRIVMLVEVFFCFWSSNWKSRIRILFQLCFFSCKTSRWETSAKPAEPSVAFRKCSQLLHSKAGIVKIFFVDALPVVPAAEPMFSSAKPVAAPRPPTPCREEGACVGSSQVCWPLSRRPCVTEHLTLKTKENWNNAVALKTILPPACCGLFF